MFDKDAEAEIRLQTTEASTVASEQNSEGNTTSVFSSTVRYMDDAAFHECLEKVVTTHGRLLSKLAE